MGCNLRTPDAWSGSYLQRYSLNLSRQPKSDALPPSIIYVASDTVHSRSRSSHENIINRDMDQLHEVANETNNGETDGHSPTNLSEFLLGRFCAASKELLAILDELLRDFDELLDFVRHNARDRWDRMKERKVGINASLMNS